MPDFVQVGGILGREDGFTPPMGARVVLSNFTSGQSLSRAQSTVGLKYVATGAEIYRYHGKTYQVRAENFLVVPEGNGGDIEIGRSETGSTIGLCIYLPSRDAAPPARLDEPMIFPASCSRLGRALKRAAAEISRPRTDRKAYSERLLAAITSDIDPLIGETVRMIENIDAVKPSTRYETMRRLNVARDHLHQIIDRRVELPELARIANISRFQLLRHFRDVFGAPPAAYHRDLRLRLAREEVESRRMTCSDAAQRFGFSDCSSFSHAYRRLFGEPPVRSRAP